VSRRSVACGGDLSAVTRCRLLPLIRLAPRSAPAVAGLFVVGALAPVESHLRRLFDLLVAAVWSTAQVRGRAFSCRLDRFRALPLGRWTRPSVQFL